VFFSVFRANSWIVGHDCSLPNPFKFICRSTIRRYTSVVCETESHLKWPIKKAGNYVVLHFVKLHAYVLIQIEIFNVY
jgi:hypothetical protein